MTTTGSPWIAVHLWDWLVPSTVRGPGEMLEAFVSEQMCNAVCVWPDHQSGRFELPVDLIEKHELSVLFNFYTENVYNWMQSHTWSGGKQDQLEAYIDHWVDTIADLSRRRPGKVWWSIGHELFDQAIAQTSASDPENGVVASRKFASKQEAYEFYKQWVLTDLHKIHWSAGHIRQAKNDRIYQYGVDTDIPPDKYALGHDTGVPVTLEYLCRRGIDPCDLFMGGGGTVPCSAAYLFSLGPQFKFFWWECSYVGTGLQPGIAFIRGAAKQYGRKWLLDHSPFASRAITEFVGPMSRGLEKLGLNHRVMSTDPSHRTALGMGTEEALLDEMPGWRVWWPQHDEDGNRLGGLSTGLILRDWLWGYMSGADCIFQEAAAMTHFVKPEGGELAATPYGEAAKQFYAFTTRCGDRGETVAPVALLMDFYHGLDPGAEPNHITPFHAEGHVTWGSVPFTSGDHMANDFFSAAFPGHGAWPDVELPWKDDHEYSRMLRAGLDERPYDRQTVVAGPWGDIFDVILDNADVDMIDRYEAVVVLGDIRLSSEWMEKLRTFAEAGGKVMLDAMHVSGQGQEWLNCDTIGPSDSAQQIGKGEIWLTDFAHSSTLFLAAVHRFLSPMRQISVDGPPLASIVNRRDNGDMLITLANPCHKQWIGCVRVPGAAASEGLVGDIWNDTSVLHEPDGDDLILHLVVPQWGLKVIEILWS